MPLPASSVETKPKETSNDTAQGASKMTSLSESKTDEPQHATAKKIVSPTASGIPVRKASSIASPSNASTLNSSVASIGTPKPLSFGSPLGSSIPTPTRIPGQPGLRGSASAATLDLNDLPPAGKASGRSIVKKPSFTVKPSPLRAPISSRPTTATTTFDATTKGSSTSSSSTSAKDSATPTKSLSKSRNSSSHAVLPSRPLTATSSAKKSSLFAQNGAPIGTTAASTGPIVAQRKLPSPAPKMAFGKPVPTKESAAATAAAAQAKRSHPRSSIDLSIGTRLSASHGSTASTSFLHSSTTSTNTKSNRTPVKQTPVKSIRRNSIAAVAKGKEAITDIDESNSSSNPADTSVDTDEPPASISLQQLEPNSAIDRALDAELAEELGEKPDVEAASGPQQAQQRRRLSLQAASTDMLPAAGLHASGDPSLIPSVADVMAAATAAAAAAAANAPQSNDEDGLLDDSAFDMDDLFDDPAKSSRTDTQQESLDTKIGLSDASQLMQSPPMSAAQSEIKAKSKPASPKQAETVAVKPDSPLAVVAAAPKPASPVAAAAPKASAKRTSIDDGLDLSSDDSDFELDLDADKKPAAAAAAAAANKAAPHVVPHSAAIAPAVPVPRSPVTDAVQPFTAPLQSPVLKPSAEPVQQSSETAPTSAASGAIAALSSIAHSVADAAHTALDTVVDAAKHVVHDATTTAAHESKPQDSAITPASSAQTKPLLAADAVQTAPPRATASKAAFDSDSDSDGELDLDELVKLPSTSGHLPNESTAKTATSSGHMFKHQEASPVLLGFGTPADAQAASDEAAASQLSQQSPPLSHIRSPSHAPVAQLTAQAAQNAQLAQQLKDMEAKRRQDELDRVAQQAAAQKAAQQQEELRRSQQAAAAQAKAQADAESAAEAKAERERIAAEQQRVAAEKYAVEAELKVRRAKLAASTEALASGIDFTKIPRSGAPKLTKIYVAQEGDAWLVKWDSKKKKDDESQIPLADCSIVTIGRLDHGLFQDKKWAKQFAGESARCISFQAPTRSLDLVAVADADVEHLRRLLASIDGVNLQ